MKKFSRLIISLVLIMSLVITAVPRISFADSGVDFPGNPTKDEYDYKNDNYNDSDWYFDEKGNPTDDTNSIYWVKFRVTDKTYLSFESNNIYIELINVKGGNRGYRVYDDLGYSGTGLRAPIMYNNDKEIVPEISHYSFKMEIVPPTDPDPWQGAIKVIKTFVDSEDEEIDPVAGVGFTLTGPNYNETKPYEVDDEAIMFTGLYKGIYFLTESTPDEYTSSLGDGIEINLQPENTIDNLYEVEVTNTKRPEEPTIPDEGKLILRKIVVDENENPIDDKSQFTFDIYKLDDIRPLSLNDNNDYENGAHYGTYDLPGNNEIEITLEYGRYLIVEDVPEGYTPISNNIVVLISEEDQTIVFTNVKKPDDTPTTPPQGKITVNKIVLNRSGKEAEGNKTRFYFDLLKKLEDGTWENKGRMTIVGSKTDTFIELEDGEYIVREVNIDSDYRLISDNDVKVTIVEGSSEEVEFTNKLRPISPPEDPKDPKEPEEPEKPEEPKPEVEDEEIIEEPQPEPEPEPEPEDEVEVEILEVIEEEVEEPVPEAKPTLPKTGTASPFIYSGLGTVLLGLGLFLKKKED